MYKTFNLIIAGLVMFIVGGEIFAKADIDFNGDLQYRFRYHYVKLKSSEGEDSSAAPDFLNRYAWNLKWKINVNENLLFGIRLSNPSGYATDNIPDNMEWVTKGNYNLLAIPELFFKWTVEVFSLSAGIIQVKPNAVLNLIAYENNNYLGAGISPWSVLMNNSQKGLSIDLKLAENETFSFGTNLIAAIAKDAGGTDTANAMIHDQIRLILSFPTTMFENKVSLLPVMHVRFNAFRTRDTTLDEASHTIAGGCDVKADFTEKFSFLLGAAGGLFNNKCEEGDSAMIETDPVTHDSTLALIPQIAPLGMLLHAGILYKDGFGKFILDFKFGRARDREASQVINNNLLHWDIKYAMPIKSLVIMPRMRIWYFTKDETDATETRLRPELILKASF